MSTEKLSDYQKALRIASAMPRFYLGQEVQTKDGKGIIVDLKKTIKNDNTAND